MRILITFAQLFFMNMNKNEKFCEHNQSGTIQKLPYSDRDSYRFCSDLELDRLEINVGFWKEKRSLSSLGAF